MKNTSTDDNVEPWVRRSRVQFPGFAVLATGFAVGVTLLFAINAGGSWGDQIGLSLVLGAWAGFFIAAARCRIDVYRDRLYLVNLWRYVVIDRVAVGRMSIDSGIRIILTDRTAISTSVYMPALGKRLIGNGHGHDFGVAMADRLKVGLDMPAPTATVVPDGTFRTTLRRDVPAFMVTTALVIFVIGIAARLLTT